MSQSLYLKYRPQGFESVVGQQHVIDVLRAQLARQEFSQSYLLYGPRGTGKTSTARLIAKASNATLTDDGSIDREHDPLITHIQNNDTLDFVEIDAASHTGVDNIREEIINKAIYPPTTLRKKVYIIDEVHMLSKGAFNALLKIMEEPRDYLIFILATTEIHKVPDTIISRCQTFTFRNLTITQITHRLEYIAQQESIEYEPQGLELIAKLSNGALRDGIKYLEQVSILGKVTQETVSKFLGVVSGVVIEGLMQSIVDLDYDGFEKQFDDLVDRGTDLSSLAKDIFVRLDEHFTTDPARWSLRVTIIQQISAEMRRYPKPQLLWKKKIWEGIHGREERRENHKSGNNKEQITKNKEQRIEKKEERRENKEEKTKEKDELKNTSPSRSDKGFDVRANTIRQDSISTSQQTQTASTDTPSVDDTPVSDAVAPVGSSSFSGTNEELLTQLTASIDKKMVQSILSKQTSLDSYVDGKMTLIVINRMYADTLKKEDTLRYVEDKASEIVGSPVQIAVVYMSKEDFMKKQLEG